MLKKTIGFLDETDEKLRNFAQNQSITDSNAIYTQMESIDKIRTLMENNVALPEQLNQLALELSASHQNPAMQNLIRQPVSEIGQRWNKIHSKLNEYQKNLSYALLNMGEFDQSCRQLTSWIKQATVSLESINTNSGSRQSIDIELCKFRNIQNGIEKCI